MGYVRDTKKTWGGRQPREPNTEGRCSGRSRPSLGRAALHGNGDPRGRRPGLRGEPWAAAAHWSLLPPRPLSYRAFSTPAPPRPEAQAAPLLQTRGPAPHQARPSPTFSPLAEGKAASISLGGLEGSLLLQAPSPWCSPAAPGDSAATGHPLRWLLPIPGLRAPSWPLRSAFPPSARQVWTHFLPATPALRGLQVEGGGDASSSTSPVPAS